MFDQIRVIVWAHYRTLRNHLPRTSFGSVLAGALSGLWYSLYLFAANLEISLLRDVPLPDLAVGLPVGLLALAMFWQLFPLVSVSTGWSLDLSKLLVYPVTPATLLLLELTLRVTSAPEALILLGGAVIGLMRHPALNAFAPLWLLLYVPLNLCIALAVREALMRLVARKSRRPVVVFLFAALSAVPSLLVGTRLNVHVNSALQRLALTRFTPWLETARLTLAPFSITALLTMLFAIAAAAVIAALQFRSSLDPDRALSRTESSGERTRRTQFLDALYTLPDRLFADPFAALLQKELRILSRSPRFRVVFGIATLFSLVIFLPFLSRTTGFGLSENHFLPAVNAYSLLIVGELVLWNTFGFDRKAAQLYFVAPVPFQTVVRAKNTVALVAIGGVNLVVLIGVALIRLRLGLEDVLVSALLTLVLSLFLLAFGNISSVAMPKPVDPGQAFRTYNSAKASLWLFLSLAVLAVPIGLALAAGWAFEARWPFYFVLLADLAMAAITYYVATASAVEMGERNREQMLNALAQGTGPVSS